jgi:hypothetical protein
MLTKAVMIPGYLPAAPLLQLGTPSLPSLASAHSAGLRSRLHHTPLASSAADAPHRSIHIWANPSSSPWVRSSSLLLQICVAFQNDSLPLSFWWHTYASAPPFPQHSFEALHRSPPPSPPLNCAKLECPTQALVPAQAHKHWFPYPPLFPSCTQHQFPPPAVFISLSFPVRGGAPVKKKSKIEAVAHNPPWPPNTDHTPEIQLKGGWPNAALLAGFSL